MKQKVGAKSAQICTQARKVSIYLYAHFYNMQNYQQLGVDYN